jgi:ribonuclease BN (tRNA processing enzyme)
MTHHPQKEPDLVILGSGTPTPSLRRACSGYLLRHGDDVILMDHGFGAYHRLLEAGHKPTDVTHVFLSHLHYDHFGDLARLILTRWDQGAGRLPELQIYGPPPLARLIDRMIADDGVFGLDLIARTQNECSLDVYRARGGVGARARPVPVIHEISPGQAVHGRDWTMRVDEVCHFKPHLLAYGYRFEAAGRSIVYSGDTGPCDGIRRLAKDADVLIHMVHHLSGTEPSEIFARFCTGHREAAALAQEQGARKLVLTHITEQYDRPGVRERVIREMGQHYEGEIIFGEDLMQIPLALAGAGKLD